ncbi:aromatic-ring-hydroxylating dioxygenase subunit beta [Xenophilus azovorans]|uniref:aromatic-ring-hydroxylating dioxygenase subunit beta n=1 Tax=Xenophilus azovorans TaxID=151755 RepID=UPI0005717DDA|nr:aromatic-ring-hydroxylating dioxygenase subunit beta [Xenophilus azovorans]
MNMQDIRSSEPTVDEAAVHKFLYLEARLQDEHRYEQWESLWLDDGLYWVPAGSDDTDPERQLSFIYDNRARIAGRVRQLMTGRRYAQSPQSRLRRVVGNIEIESVDEKGVRVASNFMLAESRRGVVRHWAGRTVHILKPGGDAGFRMAMKKVLLVDNDAPIETLAFLI